jgi:hypothetical protein
LSERCFLRCLILGCCQFLSYRVELLLLLFDRAHFAFHGRRRSSFRTLGNHFQLFPSGTFVFQELAPLPGVSIGG